MGQGERWFYGDEEARENPEAAVQPAEFGPKITALTEAALGALKEATAAAALADQKANKDLSDALEGSVTEALLDVDSVTGVKIKDGAVTAAKINVAQLDAISADVGTVTAGVVQNFTGTAKFDLNNSRIVFDNGTVVKITGLGFGVGSQFIEWVGLREGVEDVNGDLDLSLCDLGNALQYITVGGNAYFGGTLSAGVLKNGATATALGTGLVLTVGPFTTNGGSRNVVLSYSCHEHGSGTITASSGTISATIELHRSVNGGASSLIGTLNVTQDWIREGDPGSYFWDATMGGSLTTTDSTGVADDEITYTATITSRTVSAGAGTVTVQTQNTTIISTEE